MITVEITDSAGATLTSSYDHDGQVGRDILTGLSGWTGGVGVRSEDVARLSHGSFLAPSTRTGRTLTIDMVFERDTRAELWALERAASGLFSDGGYGILTVTQDITELFCEVRLDGEVKPIVNLDGGYMTLQVPLHAPMPYIYSPWRESTLQPVGAGVGFEFAPFSRAGVISFGSAVSTDEWIWNEGNAESAPVFTVTADSPGFAVGVGDNRVTYPWPTFLDIPVTVDMAGAVYVGGVDQSHLLGERRWGTVPPGSIESVRFEFLNGGTGWATVRHRDTFI